MRLLAAKDKLKAVLEVVNDGKTLQETSLKYACCRQSLSKWVQSYKQSFSANKSGRSLESLKTKYRRGARHPRHASWKVEREILDLVVKYPAFSIYSIKKELSARSFLISTSGIYQVLIRHGLQTHELRFRFSMNHPVRTVFAHAMSTSVRSRVVEEYLSGGKKVSEICRTFAISRPTFYLWLKRYQRGQGRVESLERQYRRGVLHQRSTISPRVRQTILKIISTQPALSCHKLYVQLAASRVGAVTHQALQNLLFREGLNVFSSRLEFAKRFVRPIQEVAPLYVPEMPLYKLHMILAPFVTVPKLMLSNRRQGLYLLAAISLPLFLFAIFVRSILGALGHVSPIGMIFASVALFFGLFFFIYSLSYYMSIFMVLKLVQSGTNSSQQRTTDPSPASPDQGKQ